MCRPGSCPARPGCPGRARRARSGAGSSGRAAHPSCAARSPLGSGAAAARTYARYTPCALHSWPLAHILGDLHRTLADPPRPTHSPGPGPAPPPSAPPCVSTPRRALSGGETDRGGAPAVAPPHAVDAEAPVPRLPLGRRAPARPVRLVAPGRAQHLRGPPPPPVSACRCRLARAPGRRARLRLHQAVPWKHSAQVVRAAGGACRHAVWRARLADRLHRDKAELVLALGEGRYGRRRRGHLKQDDPERAARLAARLLAAEAADLARRRARDAARPEYRCTAARTQLSGVLGRGTSAPLAPFA